VASRAGVGLAEAAIMTLRHHSHRPRRRARQHRLAYPILAKECQELLLVPLLLVPLLLVPCAKECQDVLLVPVPRNWGVRILRNIFCGFPRTS
jgi:hypothetical protein